VGFQMEILLYIDGLFLCFRKLIANSSVFVPCKRILPIQTCLADIYNGVSDELILLRLQWGYEWKSSFEIVDLFSWGDPDRSESSSSWNR